MAKSTCSVEGCENAYAAKGYCGKHYNKVKRYGDPLAEGPGRGRTGIALASRECSEPGCIKPVRSVSTGLCRGHNQLFFRTGSTDPIVGTVERFKAKVQVAPSGCWEWLGGRLGQNSQYGQFSMAAVGRPVVGAHRAAWELFRGPIPEGLTIDHLCRNTICVNPDHLEPVTQKVNNQRYAVTITHCPQGHEYTPENTAHYGRGRQCRTCLSERAKARRREAPK
jgi:hypothetical protein